MASQRRLALFAVAAAALASLVCLLVAEVVLRVVDYPPTTFSPWIRSDALGFRLAPDIRMPMTTPEYEVEVATNSLGFRDEEPGPKQGRRILTLGDSFTMGYGVERGQMFPDLLERDLSLDVVNTGTGGYEIVHQLQVLREYGKALAPDLVVYTLYLGNDLAQNDEWERGGDGATLKSLVRQYPTRQPRQIKLVQLAKNVVYGARLRRGEKEGEWLPFEGYLALCARDLGKDAAADYDLSTSLLRELAEQVRALDARLLVVLLPYRSMVEPEAKAALAAKVPDLDAAYDLTRPAREIGSRLTGLGIDYLDATPALVEAHRSGGASLYFAIDGHLNAAGHRALANILREPVRERLARAGNL